MTDTLSPKDIQEHIESRCLHPTMAVTITETAANAVRVLRTDKAEYRGLPLRVYIDGKGCDGFYYGVTFDTKAAEDFSFNSENIEIIVDPNSLSFLFGSVIDWVNDVRGTGFLVQNPNHERYRGKFYKKKAWTQALVQS